MVIAEFHRSVDVARARYPSLDHAHGFETQGNAQTTGRESGNVAHYDWLFPHSPGHCPDSIDSPFNGFLADNNFDQAHEMHRVEEVHADHLYRTSCRARNLGYR